MQEEFGSEYDEKTSVEWLQNGLLITVNGVYDAATKDAVSKLQKDMGLTVTGVADAAIITALKK